MTLVETLVVVVLLMLIFSYIYRLIVPGLRAWAKGDVKVKVQQAALVSFYRLTSELKETNRNTISIRKYDVIYDGVSTLICFASSRDREGALVNKTETWGITGKPQWQKYIFYYLDKKERFRRYEMDPVTKPYSGWHEDRGMHFRQDPLGSIDPDNVIRDRVIANNVRTFEILYNPSENSWENGLDVTVTAYGTYGSTEEFSTCLRTTIRVRYNDEE